MNEATDQLPTAAEIVRAGRGGLSRYQRVNARRIKLRGMLEDVSTIPDDMICWQSATSTGCTATTS